MGNILRDQCQFFSIPSEFVESGCLRDCSPSAVKLYVALFHFGQKHSAARLEFSNAQLQNYAGLDTKSIKSARDLLCNLRLIEVSKGSLGVYTYILLNPNTKLPFSPLAGRTGLKRYHSPPKGQSKQQSEPHSDRVPAKPELPMSGGGGAPNLHAPKLQIDSRLAFRCFSCKGEECWTRGTERICLRCHPDPRGSILQHESSSPTAIEVGF